jgi:5-methylcytosine-specific restriction endonuclease McrA
MDSMLLVSFLVIAILFAGIIFLQLASQRRKRRFGKAKRSLKGGRRIFKRRDHGARVARRHGRERSPQWSRVQKEHLLREPACVACGHKGRGLQVHHVKPFHLHPQLELDPRNLITLCEGRGRDHHLLLGHLGEWQSYNEHIREDAKRFYRKTAVQIRADLSWQKKMKLRP